MEVTVEVIFTSINMHNSGMLLKLWLNLDHKLMPSKFNSATQVDKLRHHPTLEEMEDLSDNIASLDQQLNTFHKFKLDVEVVLML
jgi:hypothetical protein